MKVNLLLFFITIGIANLNAQQYVQSAGLRLGPTTGITYRVFTERNQAVEMMVSGRHTGLQFTTQYLFFSPAKFDFDDNFMIHYGIGGHFGFERLNEYEVGLVPYSPDYQYRDRNYFTMGIDANLGLEYRMIMLPLTLGMDVKPYFTFVGFRQIVSRFWDASFSIKYILDN